MFKNGAFTFIITNGMVVQQVIKIEYSLLQWINRGRAGDVFVEVEFLPGKDWQPFPFTPGTGQLTEKAARSEAGVSYKTEVKCNVTMDNPSMLSGFSTLEHADVVIRVMYNSGEWKVIGIPGNPVKTLAELEVAKSGLFKVSFQCDSIYRTRFLKA